MFPIKIQLFSMSSSTKSSSVSFQGDLLFISLKIGSGFLSLPNKQTFLSKLDTN